MAPKDVFYFSHDANARREDKCIALRGLYGWAGYGRFWAIVEILRESTNYRINITTEFAIAKIAEEIGLGTDEAREFIQVLIDRFQLLKTDGENIWSDSLNRRMEHFESRRTRMAERGKAGAKQRWKTNEEILSSNNNSTHAKNDSISIIADNTSIDFDSKKRKKKKKEKKEREEKEREEADASLARAPSSVDVMGFFQEFCVLDPQSEAERFWNHYEAIGWMKGKTPIRDWKYAARSWIDKIGEFRTITSQHGATLTQQLVEFDPGAIERDTAQALAELKATEDVNRSRGSP